MAADDHTALAVVEIALNRALAGSVTAQRECEYLAGSTLALHFTDLGLALYLLPYAGGIQVLTRLPGPADTTLQGSLLGISRLGAVEEGQGMLFSGEVTLLGDVEKGEHFKRLLRLARPDWEEALSRLAGDGIAHGLSWLTRGLGQRLARGLKRVGANVAEYLQYERRTLAEPEVIAAWAEEVDRLRDDMARLEARIRRLQARSR